MLTIRQPRDLRMDIIPREEHDALRRVLIHIPLRVRHAQPHPPLTFRDLLIPAIHIHQRRVPRPRRTHLFHRPLRQRPVRPRHPLIRRDPLQLRERRRIRPFRQRPHRRILNRLHRRIHTLPHRRQRLVVAAQRDEQAQQSCLDNIRRYFTFLSIERIQQRSQSCLLDSNASPHLLDCIFPNIPICHTRILLVQQRVNSHAAIAPESLQCGDPHSPIHIIA